MLLSDKDPYSQSYGFFSSHVQMWELGHKEGCVPKNWCFWTVVLEKTLESPLSRKEIKPGNPKGNQPWIFIAKTDNEAEAPILWPPDAKRWKIPWCWERLRAGGEGVNRGWDGWKASPINGYEFEQTLRESERQGGPVSCSPWGGKEVDTT